MLKGKRGSVQDLIFIGVVLLFFALVILFSFKITTEYNAHLQTSSVIPANAKAASTTLLGYYDGVIDNMFLFLVVGLVMVALISAALVRVHPIFIPIFIIAWIFIIFLSGVLSNIYQEVAANPLMSAQADQLTFIDNILTFLPFLIGIVGILLMVVTYKLGGEAG